MYSLMENFNLGKYANSELAWTLNTNTMWWWWTNWHRIPDQGAKRA